MLAVSTVSRPQDLERCTLAGFDLIFDKSADPAGLLEALRVYAAERAAAGGGDR
jgi:hypothetical protein